MLESDRKCKAEDEGGEQKGPFLHFHNLVGFMSEEKLITWDKSLAGHCRGLCREGVRRGAGRAYGSNWGALGGYWGHWEDTGGTGGTPRSWG